MNTVRRRLPRSSVRGLAARTSDADAAMKEWAAIAEALRSPPLQPTCEARIWAKIESRLIEPQRVELRSAGPFGEGHESFEHHLRTETGWQLIGPGVQVRVLQRRDAVTAFLIQIAAGHELPEHDHDANEESVLLSGDAWINDVYYATAGDVHLARAGTRHGPIRSPKGCVLYVRVG
jgi:anti-sigma factor ChrR (cupin superfamily)